MDIKKELDGLHAALAKKLKEVLQDDPSASELNVIRQFLKDNSVDSVSTPKSDLGEIAMTLPTFNEKTGDFSNTDTVN